MSVLLALNVTFIAGAQPVQGGLLPRWRLCSFPRIAAFHDLSQVA